MEYGEMSRYYWKNDLIQLRRPKADDIDALLPNQYDSAARFFFNEELELPVDVEGTRKQFAESLEPGKLDYICFAIENREGEHVGIANLFGMDERNGKFGPIGLQINPAHRGKGYGIAAMRMLGNYLFQERRMHKWNSGYIEGNRASETLHKKLGFSVEGVQKDMFYHDGRYWNQVLCGITEAAFFENERRLDSCRKGEIV